MIIKAVRFYQAIYIGNTQHTHVNYTPKSAIKMSWQEGVGVRIEHNEDISIVPFNNLAYIQVLKDAPAAKEAATPKKAATKAG